MRGESTYPFQNKSIKNLPGEIWEKIPDWKIYHISNYGRAKVGDRWVSNNLGGKIIRKGRILSQQAITSEISPNGDSKYYLFIVTNGDNCRKRFPTARLVYYLFVKNFALDDRRLVIQYKDGNGLNILPSNLTLTTRSILMQNLSGSWPNCLVKVTQFDLEGKKIQVYDTTAEAVAAVNGRAAGLLAALSKKSNYYKGYFWCKGDLEKPKRLIPKGGQQKPIIQYSLEGEKLAVFPCISKAAEYIGVKPQTLRKAVGVEKRSCKGFRWKWHSSIIADWEMRFKKKRMRVNTY